MKETRNSKPEAQSKKENTDRQRGVPIDFGSGTGLLPGVFLTARKGGATYLSKSMGTARQRAAWFSSFEFRVSSLMLSALMLLIPSPAGYCADEPPSPKFEEITPPLTAAVEKGLLFLARNQNSDGSFDVENYGKHAGIISLAALAFMAHGDLPGRGKYGPNVEKALQFVLANARETGLVASDGSHGPMYGHGFATLFLAEVYGQTNDPRVREVLAKAVRLIVRCQNPEGGWRYQPVPQEADLSVTICQVMALRAARNAGIKVPKETIDRAVEYVRRCQNPDGGFRYMLNSGNSAFPRSAAGVATLYYAGIYSDPRHPREHTALLLRPLLRRADHVHGRRRLLAQVVRHRPRGTGQAPGSAGRQLAGPGRPGLRDRHGPDHSPDAQPLSADFSEMIFTTKAPRTPSRKIIFKLMGLDRPG